MGEEEKLTKDGESSKVEEKSQKDKILDTASNVLAAASLIPDADQALAWKRLMSGENIKETDFLLLEHEFEELKLIKQQGMVYEDELY